jgi:DNA polymerase-1
MRRLGEASDGVNAPEIACVDFETWPIAQRPNYPPKPVGVSIKLPREESYYYAWGHPAMNNCGPGDGYRALRQVWDSGLPILFHNAKFDLSVACEGMKLPELSWDRVHDTMFLAYLCDPHARSLGLKELAADLLNWPPAERDALAEWVLEHAATLVATYGGQKPTKSKVGAWIFSAPGNVVGPYAEGDTERTAGLFSHLWPIVQENGMGAAYDRERRLLPILMENERDGMRTDLEGLERDTIVYGASLVTVEDWLRRELRASGLNFDADQDLASVLLSTGAVLPEKFQRTKKTKAHPNGQLSVSKDTLLPEHFVDPRVASALGYRNRLKTCLTMFMEPWRDQARDMNGHVTTNWNQVRNPAGGTRTGRPSTNGHNFLNISNDFDGRTDGYVHPEFLALPRLPLCRKYILPDDGEVFLHRDFDGQELRVFAHFEQGQLWDGYQADPAMDPHAMVSAELKALTGTEFERTKVKVLNFQAIYGGGVPAAQKKLNCSYAEAKQYKAFHEKALPGRKILMEEIQRLVRRGEPIHTWGGRLYFPEEPRVVDGRMMTWEYKLINYLVQGSAADLTKESIIQWRDAGARARFLVTVYDEINCSAHPDIKDAEMKLLREVMEEPRLTVPMRSSGKEGPNWGSLTKCL